jgi:hypothetical protein
MPKIHTTFGSSLTENKIIDSFLHIKAQNLKLLRTEIDINPKTDTIGLYRKQSNRTTSN